MHGDRQMLCQVFVNLILNAVDIVPQHGRIEISVHPDREEGYLAVDVRDNEPGFPITSCRSSSTRSSPPSQEARGRVWACQFSQGIVRKLGGYIRVATRKGEAARSRSSCR